MKTSINERPTQPLKQPKRKMGKVKKIFLITGLSFVGLLILLFISAMFSTPPISSSLSQAQKDSHTEQVQPAPKATEQPKVQQPALKPKEPKPVQKSVEQQLQDITKNSGILGKVDTADSTYDPDSKIFVVFDDIGDGSFGNDDFAKIEIFNIQKAIWTSKLAGQVSEVRVNVTMNLTDNYGKTENMSVAWAHLTSDNAKNFVWDNTSSKQAWDVYDSTWLRPGDGWK